MAELLFTIGSYGSSCADINALDKPNLVGIRRLRARIRVTVKSPGFPLYWFNDISSPDSLSSLPKMAQMTI
jgi:hypothetical protein